MLANVCQSCEAQESSICSQTIRMNWAGRLNSLPPCGDALARSRPVLPDSPTATLLLRDCCPALILTLSHCIQKMLTSD